MKNLLSTTLFIIGFLLLATISASANGDTLTTASGIKYVQITQGNGVHPIKNQKVKIIYSRKLATGEVVESNELSKPFEYTVDKTKVIPGIDEIIKQMSEGEELYCVIPPALAHGEKGVKGSVDPNVTFYLYIRIIDIK
jgi:FKBP-type peptidyl-prolyl cis-trans isomerase